MSQFHLLLWVNSTLVGWLVSWSPDNPSKSVGVVGVVGGWDWESCVDLLSNLK